MFAAFARLNYKPWFALAELVDNAVQSHLANLSALRNHGVGGPLVVDIVFEDDEISVTDRAWGIALKDFERAFSPATPPPDPTGLSEFGLGMKASASWFAREWSVRTSALGDPVERMIAFDIPKITREGLERLPGGAHGTFPRSVSRASARRPVASSSARSARTFASVTMARFTSTTSAVRMVSAQRSAPASRSETRGGELRGDRWADPFLRASAPGGGERAAGTRYPGGRAHHAAGDGGRGWARADRLRSRHGREG